MRIALITLFQSYSQMHSAAHDALVMDYVRSFENVSALMDGQEVIAHRERHRTYRGTFSHTDGSLQRSRVFNEVHVIEIQALYLRQLAWICV